jgi:hypothetical protein
MKVKSIFWPLAEERADKRGDVGLSSRRQCHFIIYSSGLCFARPPSAASSKEGK